MKKIYTFLILSFTFLCSIFAQKHKVIEHPLTGWRNTPFLEVSKIELSDTATVLFFDIFLEEGNGFTFSKDSYLQANGKQYAMKGYEGFTPGRYTPISASGQASARLIFLPVNKKTTQIDFMEGADDKNWKVFDIDLTGKRQTGKYPEGLPDDLKDIKPNHQALLPEPTLEIGMTTVRVHLLGYRQAMGTKMNLYVNDFVPSGQRELTANISEEGIAEFVFPQNGTVQAFGVLNSRTCGSIWLKPGETADIYADQLEHIRMYTEEHYNIEPSKKHILGYYRGFYSDLNNAQEGLHHYDLELYNGKFADYHMTADEYAAHVKSQYEKQIALLDADSTLPPMLREYERIILGGMAVEAMFDSKYLMEHNYRHEHNQWDRSQPLDYQAPELSKEHFAWLKTLGLDSPKVMYADHTITSFTNRKMFEEHISGASLISSDTCSFLCELAKVNQYMSDISNMKFLTEEQEHTLSSLTYPFFYNVCHNLQQEIKDKMEELKNKTGYMICDIPDVVDNELFDAIAKRYSGKVVVVDFWATWCAPCRAAIKEMEPMKDDKLNDKDLMFVYLTGDSSPEAVWQMMIADIRGHHYRLNKQQWNSVCNKFGIAYIPSYVLIQKDGSYSLCNEMADHHKAVNIIREALAK